MKPNPANDEPEPDDARQRLVAYLDGELSAQEASDLEAHLAHDPTTQKELQQFDRVWNALDALPQATVGDAFTRSTIAVVTADIEREVQQLTVALPTQRRRRSYAGIAACLAALLVGLFATRTLATRNDRRVLAALPVVYQFDALHQFRDLDFLRQLHANAPRLVKEYEAAELQEKTVAERAEDWRQITAGASKDRAAWIATQADAEKLRLQRAMRRYAGSRSATREAAANLLDDLHAQPDAPELYTAAVAYQAWLATQTPATQSRLRQIEGPTARFNAVSKAYAASLKKANRTLSDNDANALHAAIKDLVDDPGVKRFRAAVAARLKNLANKRQPARITGVPFGQRAFGQRFQAFPAGPVLLIADLVGDKTNRQAKFMRMTFRDQYARLVAQAEQAWPPIEARLTRDLSPATRNQLATLQPTQRTNRLRQWVREVAVTAFRPGTADLEAFFAGDTLSDAERHNLLALPTDKMMQQLEKRYTEEQLGVATPASGFGGQQNDRRPRRRSRQP